jgi:hypothetical protein
MYTPLHNNTPIKRGVKYQRDLQSQADALRIKEPIMEERESWI